MFKKMNEGWMALRNDLATITTSSGEKITVTQNFNGAAFYFETKKGNYALSLQTLIDEFLKFREKEEAETAHHALTGE